MARSDGSKRIHLEIQQHRKNPIGLFRTTYYDNGKIKHETIGRVVGVGLQELKLIQATLQGRAVMKDEFMILRSKEYGATRAMMGIARQTGLDHMIYSRPSEQWARDALAMVVACVLVLRSRISGNNRHYPLTAPSVMPLVKYF